MVCTHPCPFPPGHSARRAWDLWHLLAQETDDSRGEPSVPNDASGRCKETARKTRPSKKGPSYVG